MTMHKKTFTVDVNDEVSEAFSNQVEERGYTKYRAIEAAMKAFIAIPPEAQVALMSNNADAQDVLFNTFRDMGLKIDLQKLSPIQRTQILALAKEAAKKVSRKK